MLFWNRVLGKGLVACSIALTASIAIGQRGHPDLTVSAVDRSSVASNTATMAVTGVVRATISNSGSAAAIGSVQVVAYQDRKRQGYFNARGDDLLGSLPVTLNLAPGQSTQVSIAISGSLIFRDAPIQVWVDASRQIAESNDRNNGASSIAVTKPVADISVSPAALKWHWPGGTALGSYDQVMMTPLVVPVDDTNGDGRFDNRDESRVIAVAYQGTSGYYQGGVLHVLSGRTGAQLRANTSQLVEAVLTPAVADIDRDGVPEIVTVAQGAGLIAFNRDLSVKWTSSVPLNRAPNPTGGIAIADIDGDGRPEIFFGNQVFNANGTLKWQAPTANVGGYCCNFQMWTTPVVTRLSSTGAQVLLLGGTALSATGTLLWSNALVGDGMVAIADLDKDGTPEIVVAAADGNRLFALRPDGTVKWGPVVLPGAPGALGFPVIADFDGDGFPDIGVPSGDGTGYAANQQNYFSVVTRDGVVRGSYPINIWNGPNAASAFDFDANGSWDAVIASYERAMVLNGRTGSTLFSADSPSGTLAEGPAVADIDGDGIADFVVGSNWGGVGNFDAAKGVRVFSSASGRAPWAGTRRIWNQHAYSITNINDDLSVPRNPAASWQTSNSFRVNLPVASQGTGIDISASRLRVLKDQCRDDDDDDCRCDDNEIRRGKSLRVSVRIGNAGGVEVPKKVSVAVYGQSRGGLVWLGNGKTNEKLAPGEYDDVKISVRSLSGLERLVVVADDSGTGQGVLNEVNRINNRVEISLPR